MQLIMFAEVPSECNCLINSNIETEAVTKQIVL